MPLCTSLLLAFLLLLHTLVLIRAMLVEDRDPYSRLAWAMAITLLPLVGIGAYAMLGEPWMSARFRRQANRVYIATIVTRTHVTRNFGSVRSTIVAIKSSAGVPSIGRNKSIAIMPMTVTRRMAMATSPSSPAASLLP